jgi:ferredoxin-thioredoxin reductase catalytic subunit
MEERKRCAYCGRFFRPDRRVGDRQKSCSSPQCRVRRKKEAQERWLAANPGYFRGRYGNTKHWREFHPEYQRLWRARRREIQDKIRKKSPMESLRLVIPAKWFKGEIQDEIRLVRQCGCGFFVTGEVVRDTRHDGALAKGQATIGSS